jgi:hypothetical protein
MHTRETHINTRNTRETHNKTGGTQATQAHQDFNTTRASCAGSEETAWRAITRQRTQQ